MRGTAKGVLGTPSPEERGALFEALIAMLLRASKDLKLCEYDSLAYWSGGNTEVDFILIRGKERIAIEVKVASEPNSQYLKGVLGNPS
jgi:predicted AAA+ superfamily ATPase